VTERDLVGEAIAMGDHILKASITPSIWCMEHIIRNVGVVQNNSAIMSLSKKHELSINTSAFDTLTIAIHFLDLCCLKPRIVQAIR
jgi:hypothetical protein